MNFESSLLFRAAQTDSSLSSFSGHLNPTSPNVCPCFLGGKINKEKKICDSSCVEMSLYDEDSYYVAAIVSRSLTLSRTRLRTLLTSCFPSSSGPLRPSPHPLPSRSDLARRPLPRRSRLLPHRPHLRSTRRRIRGPSGPTSRPSPQARHAARDKGSLQPRHTHLPHGGRDGGGEVQGSVESVRERRVRDGVGVPPGQLDCV